MTRGVDFELLPSAAEFLGLAGQRFGLLAEGSTDFGTIFGGVFGLRGHRCLRRRRVGRRQVGWRIVDHFKFQGTDSQSVAYGQPRVGDGGIVEPGVLGPAANHRMVAPAKDQAVQGGDAVGSKP